MAVLHSMVHAQATSGGDGLRIDTKLNLRLRMADNEWSSRLGLTVLRRKIYIGFFGTNCEGANVYEIRNLECGESGALKFRH